MEEIPDSILLERIAIRFGCQHGLRLTNPYKLVRYYDALAWIVVHPHGKIVFIILNIINYLGSFAFLKVVHTASATWKTYVIFQPH